jgi:hypothetical protein
MGNMAAKAATTSIRILNRLISLCFFSLPIVLHPSKSKIKQLVFFAKLFAAGSDAISTDNAFRIHFFHGSGPDSHKTDGFARLAVRTGPGPLAIKSYPKGYGAGHRRKHLKNRAKTDKTTKKPPEEGVGDKNHGSISDRDRQQ